MASIREQIMQAAVAALNAGSGKPVGTTVMRSRLSAIEQSELPCIVVYQGSEPVQTMKGLKFSPILERSLNLMIELRVSDEAPDAALDPFLTYVTATLQGTTNFGGLANAILEKDITWELAEGSDFNYGRAVMTWQIDYQTATANQESRT